ncbi:MAG: 4a-hydroxytetrahydrobiopterin dehydratase [Actinomycetota bacterium]|jgi:4a-hydroxytetrahydrobiopterin dehydratase|nr:4a-hydroxytetrahydrobiopterin dehydratase [Acidimicrobiales bacterium]MEC8829044.1 4a-hydroxytetrahydrobiopterin dehydratase [Actinomycetota bacterium]MEC8975795.1 4a-hydroxytetrahydrobiopterin dehydratase [Actinomycetota bacterium]MEC9269181.1 4a-hydroxytetrahydrobiopterin dehydratase [Actinomycetota bacterium]MEC9315769.1 4a-hydroxytetrahydrobiopterin dehydratase [Actinomycetota bacterium]|tara:strand:+ start:854 stop:1144 length:291 start_codon:yes stop_codon:yes gene_type:complete
MERHLLAAEELELFLRDLPEWSVAGDLLTRTYQFADFVRAFTFMSAVAMHCERLNHHPEWSNVYGRVEVRLTTHDLGGVTSLDTALARIMEELADG